MALSSCFTGVESTKKISLSREDRKKIKPTDEELFYQGIPGIPLKDWDQGHKFFVTDNKAILVFEPHGIPIGDSIPELENKILTFTGIESRLDPAGNITLVIDFTDGRYKLPFNTGRPFENALEDVKSDQIPMLVDLKIVEQANNLLKGKQLWTRTLLWYDEKGERINGKKFVPVTIEEITPGNMVFPFKVKIKESDGSFAWLFMNAGNSGTESRSFAHLFSLTDLKKHYPSISDENWNLICLGDVAKGMTKDECRLALGTPIEVNSGHDYSRTLDIWNYENGIVLWFEDGILSHFRK